MADAAAAGSSYRAVLPEATPNPARAGESEADPASEALVEVQDPPGRRRPGWRLTGVAVVVATAAVAGVRLAVPHQASGPYEGGITAGPEGKVVLTGFDPVGGCAKLWGQCGGQGYTGPRTCCDDDCVCLRNALPHYESYEQCRNDGKGTPAAGLPQPAPAPWHPAGKPPPLGPVVGRQALPFEVTMCDAYQNCGGMEFGQLAWYQDPQALGHRVGDLAVLPGVGGETWQKVRSRWLSTPPRMPWGGDMTLQELAHFMAELLLSNPFGTGQHLPYVDLSTSPGGKVVAISQRQLAFIVANTLMGNDIVGGSGLGAALQRCTKAAAALDIVYSLTSLLAVLSRELKAGSQGNMLIATKPVEHQAGAGLSAKWPTEMHKQLNRPNLVVKVRQHSRYSAEPDFMEGGTALQGLVDIAGGAVGGGAALCEVSNTQDESLMQFYPEVLAFSFFVRGDGMLQSPMAFLGTRRYLNKIEGDSSPQDPYFGRCGTIPERDWLNLHMMVQTTSVPVGRGRAPIVQSSFIAVESSLVSGGRCSGPAATNNMCDPQRRHLDEDINFWYQAFEMTAYNPAVQGAFTSLVRRIGTGPWGAGAWQGDSQHYFLAVWLATSLLTNPPQLDYYIYDQFCENAGNQCFVLGYQGCEACIAQTGNVDPARCGNQDIWSVVQQWQGRPAQALYQSLRSVGPPPHQVFDLMR